jgi:predicted TIM-barrel fold metal-dependent hydrolase
VTPANEAWLRLTTEETIDPTLAICDPHHHLWDRPGDRYLLEELLSDTGSGHNIVSTVFVECRSRYRQDGPGEMRPIGETEFVQGVAEESESGRYGPTRVASGIVGRADLRLGKAVEPVLEAHLAASPSRFRGVRYMCSWDASDEIDNAATDPPPGLMLDPKFQEGVACLKKYDLSFEAWLYHPQLPELFALARAVPNVTIILNHVAGPLGVGPYAGRRDEVFKAWQQGIAELASCPNVTVKLGGLGMPRCGFGWHEQPSPPTSAELAGAMEPFYLWCIENFGVNRCMFESNFPVDKISYSYHVMWNVFKRITRHFSPTERAALFHDTATRVYRLPAVNP